MAIDLPSDLTGLRRDILTMGAAVEQRLSRVLSALRTSDVELARTVRHGDREIDEMELDIERRCLRMLALSQPVASDLRFIVAVLRINGDLERIGDLAKGISKRLIDIDQAPAIQIPEPLLNMGERCGAMASDALSALADEDVRLCRRIRKADKTVDELQKDVFSWVHTELPSRIGSTEAVIGMLSICRSLERISDHACNIAEDVTFLVEGTVVRHSRI